MNVIDQEKRTFQNPILPGFYPDPSICRNDEDYYLVTSSFSYFPGVPIFHSRDLVHWEQIGHVLDRCSQLDLDGGGLSRGIFAPTLRYAKGIFYMITTNMSNGGNFIVTTQNPEGPWSDPYWIEDAPGIDPSLFFDEDGRVYYTGTRQREKPAYFGDHEIWCQELDLNTMTLIGERVALWSGALNHAFFPEGPHLYKRESYYYLMIAESGTDYYHSVTIARSKGIFGPYEGNPGNPILTHRHLGRHYPIMNPGHGDLVQTQNGECWMVALASRPYGGYYRNLGRETFLLPVEWEDGWPIVSPGTGRIESMYYAPDLPAYQVDKLPICDHFDKPALSFVWNSVRTPREKFYSLTEKPGYLRLRLRPQTLVDHLKMPSFDAKYEDKTDFVIDNPSFIGRRQQHLNFTACTKMDFNPREDCEAAGLALIQNDNFQYRIEYTGSKGQKVIRLMKCTSRSNMNFAEGTFHYENLENKLAENLFEADEIYLKVVACGQDYSFYYGKTLEDMQLLKGDVDGRILSPDLAGGFVGTYIGMFATSNGQLSDNQADFDWFEYEELI